MIQLAWNASRTWVICSMVDIIITPLRNLASDVLFIGYVYNFIQSQRIFSDIIFLFGFIAFFYIVNVLFEAVYIGYVDPIGNIKIQHCIDQMICEKAGTVSLAAYDNAEYYEQYIFSQQNCLDVVKDTVYNMASFIAYLLGGIMGIGLISSIQPVMCVFIIAAILFSVCISYQKKKYDFQYKEDISRVKVQEEYIHRVFYIREYARELRCIPNLKDFLLEKFVKFENENESLTKEYGKKGFICGVLEILNSRIFMYWFVMLVMVLLISSDGNIAAGNLLIMTVSIGTVALLIGAIVNTIPAMNQIHMYYEKLDVFMKSMNQKNDEEKRTKREICDIENIRFDNVTFTYPNEKKPALKNISFEINRGESFVIVGENGSGKSTILKLLLKLYTEYDGNIYINGIDMRELETEGYRNLFGCVFQNTNLYAMSTENNINLEDTDVDDTRLKTVLSQSGLQSVVEKQNMMKHELTKELSEDGIILSGGNKQKVAIARALYKNAPVVVMDEITSAVDMEAEQELMDTIEKVCIDKISISISHKLSCVKKADQIVYVENGRIVEQGTHSDLIAKKGKYYDLFKIQVEQIKKVQIEHKLRNEEWV